MECLGVLDVAEGEVDREETKDYDADVIGVKPKPLSESGRVTPESLGDTFDEALCARDVLEANGTIHVQDKYEDDRILEALADDALGQNGDLDLLANVEHRVLFVQISKKLLASNDRALVLIVLKNRVVYLVFVAFVHLLLSGRNRDTFDHEGGSYVS